MDYLPPVKGKRKLLPWVLLGLFLLTMYTMLGNSTTPEKMQEYVQNSITTEVVRYDVYDQSANTKIVIIRDEHDGRTAFSFLKVPFIERWQMKEVISVPATETRPITIGVDQGFRVLTAQVGFDRVNIVGMSRWNGSYARMVSLVLFMGLAVIIHFWLEWKHRIKAFSASAEK